jgi:alpha-L-arabinofuranosidase
LKLNFANSGSFLFNFISSNNKTPSGFIFIIWNGKNVSGADGQNGLFASAVLDKNSNEIIVKIVNTSEKNQNISLNFNGLKKNEKLSESKVIILKSDDLDAENTLENPFKIVPQESIANINGNNFATEIAAYSFAVYKIKVIK